VLVTEKGRRVKEQSNKDPMHGVTLEKILEFLVADYGWGKLGTYIKIKCFQNDPTIKSSLKFLRKTPWAREKVEHLYLTTINKQKKP